MEENKTEEIKTEEIKTETPVEEKPTEEKPAEEPAEEKETDIEATIKSIKDSYEKKLTDAITKKDKVIAEQKEVIKQLIESGNTAEPKLTIADKINNKRNHKKW